MAAKIADIKRRLGRVRDVLGKRRLRVAFCKRRKESWREKFRKTGSAKALRKAAYWAEQEDKAVLGRKDYEAREARLAKKHKHLKQKQDEAKPSSGASVPDRPWNPYKRPVANWIIPWLDKSWEAGWRGVVNSGWRDPAYSESLCRAMCGAPSCPGRCAGRASNHAGSEYPNGAVDLTDQYTFAAVQFRIGSPLRNNLPADRVHFSVSGA